MLPATLVTFTTFLLEICSSSPVYNMQPAFITNTVGATGGRNIRNLPCISRRNSNQSGFCMFAIDCLKANGTHLGTCIDGFYFGSCCHVEPVHDIVDNNLDTDIIPHREPPYRISSTLKPTKGTTVAPRNESTTSKISLSSSTIMKSTTSVSTTSMKPAIENISSTMIPQKLQTFQIVDSNTLEVSTKASIINPTNSTIEVSSRPITREPTTSSTKKPVTVDAVPIITHSPTDTPKITTSKLETSSLLTISTGTTEKINLVSTTKDSSTSAPTEKPTRTTKTPIKVSSKPTKVSSKPSKITVTTKKPDLLTTKSQSTTIKPTKKTTFSSKPTKKGTATPSKVTSSKPTKITSTTEKLITKKPINVTDTNKPSLIISSTTEKANTSLPISSKPQLHKTTPSSSTISKINVTQILETVNGNPATNEIEGISKPTTMKPGLITWTVVDNKNLSTTASDIGIVSVTTEDWVPITSPDAWVLLPSVESKLNQTIDNNLPPSVSSESPELHSSSSPSTSSLNATTSTPPILTQSPPVDVPSVEANATVDMIFSSSSSTSSYVTNDIEVSSSSEASSEGTVSINPLLPVEQVDKPVNMSDFTDVCGRRMFPKARIVGGEKSSFGKWPWQISLRQWRTSTYLHKCGAALLNENWAITAAHCVDNVPPSDLLLRLGEHDLSTESEPYLHQERRVQIVASHPQFDPRTFEYDLALLRFYEPVTFQPNILPVCVPQTDENFVSRTAYVTGWGRLYEDGPLPSILQEVSVPVINNTVCESMYRAAGYIEHIPHIFICAGWRRGGFDSCEGDSGGPMVIQRQDKRFLLAGVISWGIGCAEPNQPGVYTRISEFRDWINQILQF